MSGVDSGPLYDKVFSDSDQSPEKRLFQAILLKFLMDIQTDYDLFKMSTNGVCAMYVSKLRGHSINVNHKNMELICDCAGINYRSFKRKVGRIIDGLDKVEIKSIHF